jgi:hypothetical protein
MSDNFEISTGAELPSVPTTGDKIGVSRVVGNAATPFAFDISQLLLAKNSVGQLIEVLQGQTDAIDVWPTLLTADTQNDVTISVSTVAGTETKNLALSGLNGGLVKLITAMVLLDGMSGDVSGATLLPTGATSAASIKDATANPFSVKYTGATGNGTTVDATAIAAADAVLFGEGQTSAYFPAGTYVGDGSPSAGITNTIAKGPGRFQAGTTLRTQVSDENLPVARMFNSGVGPQHLVQLHAALAAGSAVAVNVSASIFAPGGDTYSPSEYLWLKLCDEIRKGNPLKTLIEYNRGIGGKAWADFANTASASAPWWPAGSPATWQANVIALNPDLIFFNFNDSDGFGFTSVGFLQIMATLNALSKVPSILHSTSYLGTNASETGGSYTASDINAHAFCNGYVRSYAEKYGYGFLDFERWFTMVRDGFDITVSALTRVTPAAGTNLTAFGTPMPTVNGTWTFPDVINENGVAANNCTDFSINFTLNTPPNGVVQFPLFPNGINGNTPSPNQFYINLTAGNNIATAWCDSVNNNLDTNNTTIPVPTTAVAYQLTLKGNRLELSVKTTSDTYADTVPPTGLGFTTIWEGKIVRFGGSFTPYISGLGTGNTITINNLAIGNSQFATPNNQAYRPISDNNSLYVQTYGAGGSNTGHMNAYGRMRGLVPVIENCDFRPAVVPQAIVANTLTLSGLAQIQSLYCTGPIVLQPAAVTGTSGYHLKFLPSNDTALTAGTESPDIIFAGAVRQWTGGTSVALQREHRVDPPEYTATSATTFAIAATWTITGPPIAGPNATITSSVGLYIPPQAVETGGGVVATGAAAFLTAPTGATNNYALITVGRNNLNSIPASTSYANDSAAAAGGVAIGEVYRNGSTLQCRIT